MQAPSPSPVPSPRPPFLPWYRATQASMDLLNKVIHRVETENGWDQALFNECIFFPSHPGYKVWGGGVTRQAACAGC